MACLIAHIWLLAREVGRDRVAHWQFPLGQFPIFNVAALTYTLPFWKEMPKVSIMACRHCWSIIEKHLLEVTYVSSNGLFLSIRDKH